MVFVCLRFEGQKNRLPGGVTCFFRIMHTLTLCYMQLFFQSRLQHIRKIDGFSFGFCTALFRVFYSSSKGNPIDERAILS